MSFSLDLSMSLPALGDLTAISMSMSLPATLDLNAMGIISTSSTDGSSGSISSKSAKGPGGYLLNTSRSRHFTSQTMNQPTMSARERRLHSRTSYVLTYP